MKPKIPKREHFPFEYAITTRWHDNDVYGHVNNVVYYSWFDTAVNAYLIEQGVLDIEAGSVVGLVVKTQCNYYKPVAFPDQIVTGVAVSKIGTSSVRYELGVFRAQCNEACASGHFIHVYVDKSSRRPTKISENLRQSLQAISNNFFLEE